MTLKKKKNLKWNLTEGTDLQVNVSKAKVICLRGNRINFSSQSRHKFSRKKKNLIELEMFPTWTKKAEALTCRAQFSVHRH